MSRAALFGGTTTMIDFAAWEPGETIAETITKRDCAWAGQCYCDYAYHIMLRDRVPPVRLEELGRLIDAGYPTVKIFTTDITPSRRGRMIRFGDIWEIFKVVAAHGGLGVIHAEDDDIVDALAGAAKKLRSPRLRRQGEPPGTGMERDGAFYLGERAGDLRAAIVAGKAAAGLRHAASCLSMIVVVKVAIPLGSGQQ